MIQQIILIVTFFVLATCVLMVAKFKIIPAMSFASGVALILLMPHLSSFNFFLGLFLCMYGISGKIKMLAENSDRKAINNSHR
jgi:hypothetical protein